MTLSRRLKEPRLAPKGSTSCATVSGRGSPHPSPPTPREGIRARFPESLPMQVVMGIDPGAANLGFGIVRVEGNHMVALDGGVVETTPRAADGAAAGADPPGPVPS